MRERRKVSVIGAGSVGATIAYASLIRGAPNTLALYDIDRDKVRAEVLDLNQGSQFYRTATVIGRLRRSRSGSDGARGEGRKVSGKQILGNQGLLV